MEEVDRAGFQDHGTSKCHSSSVAVFDHMGFCSGFSPLIKLLPFLSSDILYEEKVLMRSSAVKRGGDGK